MMLTVILCVLYNVPRFLLEECKQDSAGYWWRYYGRYQLPTLYLWLYQSWINAALVFFLPILILSVVTVNILIVLWKRKMARSNMQSSHGPSHHDNISVILSTIVILMILCQVPFCGLQITLWIDVEAYSYIYDYANPIVHLLVCVNSATNGFIYFIMNKQFRQALVSHCSCRKRNTSSSHEMVAV